MAQRPGGDNKLIWHADESHQNMRLDVFISEQLGSDYSRSRIKSWIQDGCCKVNQAMAKASHKLESGEQVELEIPNLQKVLAIEPRPAEFEILFEDESLLVVNKPAGLVVHPGAGTTQATLIEGVLDYLQKTASELPGESDRPGVVHRLDKDTSGVLVIAKTAQAHAALSSQFKEKSNHREYLALLDGLLAENELEVRSYLTRHLNDRTRRRSITLSNYEQLKENNQLPNDIRLAISHFYRKKVYQSRLSLVSVRLETGRTHQIRVHAQSIKAPVLGDPVYRASRPPFERDFPLELASKLKALPRQMLHAWQLGFEHPVSGKALVFVAPLPKDFRELLLSLGGNDEQSQKESVE